MSKRARYPMEQMAVVRFSEQPTVRVIADGGVIRANPSMLGGTFAWRALDASGLVTGQESGVVLPADVGGPTVTNNATEFYAVLRGLEWLPDGWEGEFWSDSQVTLKRFWASAISPTAGHGTAMNGIPVAWWKRGAVALGRLGRITPVHVQGHARIEHALAGVLPNGERASIHHLWCDRECRRLAQEFYRARQGSQP